MKYITFLNTLTGSISEKLTGVLGFMIIYLIITLTDTTQQL
jgi:hypothetical protein